MNNTNLSKAAAVLLVLSTTLISCGEEETVADCSGLSGSYALQSLSCDGTTQSLSISVTAEFGDSAATMTQGVTACQTVTPYDWTPAASELNMTISGGFTCLVNGSSMTNCNEPEQSCDSTDNSLIGTENNFSSCAVSGDTVTVSRTVTAAQAGVVSPCAQDEEEILVFKKQ